MKHIVIILVLILIFFAGCENSTPTIWTTETISSTTKPNYPLVEINTMLNALNTLEASNYYKMSLTLIAEVSKTELHHSFYLTNSKIDENLLYKIKCQVTTQEHF